MQAVFTGLAKTAHTKPGDSMERSLWNDTVSLPGFPRLAHDVKTDVLIIGGGLAGILCAYELTQAGVNCLLIEANRICGGITGNTTAKVTAQHGLLYHKILKLMGQEKSRLYYDANTAALERYRFLARSIPCDWEEKRNFIYTRSEPQKLEQEFSALEALGIPAISLQEVPVPVCTVGAVGFEKQAQFHPLKLVRGLLPKLTIYENTRALAFEGNRVQTGHGKITADKIIIATHFPINNKHGLYFMKMYQHRSYVLGLKGARVGEDMYLDDGEDGLSFRNYGDILLLGDHGHRTGKENFGWSRLTEFSRRTFPQAQEVYRWAAQDCMTLDNVPYIGKYGKNTAGVYAATGFCKWGMTSSMVAAMLLKDMVLERENPYASVYDPNRRMYVPKLMVNLTESACNVLRLSKPRCPHLGCALHWNPWEHSWDCACHGSRFTESGDLLDGPANGKLK